MFRQRREWSDRRVAVALAVVALLKGLVWIALIPVFKVADEPTHFENIQFRGEQFAAPFAYGNEPFGTTVHDGSPPDVKVAWQRTNELFRLRYVPGVRSIHEEMELRQMASDPVSRHGTGRLTSANYPGFYYNTAVPIYEIFRRTSVLTRIAAVRCVSVAYGLMAVLATFFAARLVMKSQALAIAAAVVVMLQPMEAQMTAAVNNDAGLIGLAAVLFYLQLRFLVRAPEIPSPKLGILMALTAGALVFTKPQGFAMLPGCAIACGWVVASNLRNRRAWIFAGVTAACAAVLIGLSFAHLQRTGQMSLVASPASTGAAAATATQASRGFITFLRSLHEGYKVYLFRSAFGQFGWLEYSIPAVWLERILSAWVVVQIGAIVAVVLALAKAPGSTWLSMRGFLFSAYTALFTVAFVLYAEHRFRLMGVQGVIQGVTCCSACPRLPSSRRPASARSCRPAFAA